MIIKNFSKKIFVSIFGLFLISGFSAVFASGVERYAIYIGSNKGGNGRSELLYAGSDAQNFQKVMKEVGGISEENSFLLINPNENDIDEALDVLAKKITGSKISASRTEFLFYYSGHSDEEALLLGNQKYDYSNLKASISNVPSDIHVVILDSCYSGNFIRAKGGQKKKPFLMDDSSVVKGHAYLSSSSDTEYSQESDEIESSFFTNAVVSGLRGAADSSGDKKVTLNELYSYAFNETLQKTEDSKSGPQHPNYNITLVGSGDLILSDFSQTDSIVSISKEIKGNVIIRDTNGKMICEINKTENAPVTLAIPEGNYTVLLIDEKVTLQGKMNVKKDEVFVVNKNSLTKKETKETVVRGESKKTDKKKHKKEQNTNVSLMLRNPLPFDLQIENRGIFEDKKMKSYLLKSTDEIIENSRKDYTLRIIGAGEGKNLVLGTDLAVYTGKFTETGEKSIHFSLEPAIGLAKYGTIYWTVCPVVIPLNYENYKPYWDWQAYVEFGLTGSLGNFGVTTFWRYYTFWKDFDPTGKIVLGLNVGFHLPSKYHK